MNVCVTPTHGARVCMCEARTATGSVVLMAARHTAKPGRAIIKI